MEVFNLVKTDKTYENLQLVYNIFGRKYYKFPLKFINENIRVFNEKQEQIQFNIETFEVNTFEINIKTFFNENNLGILTNEDNLKLSKFCSKYEHFINFSTKKSNIYFTVGDSDNPIKIVTTEINVNRKLVDVEKKVILEESNLF
jgi:hypothetical protein